MQMASNCALIKAAPKHIHHRNCKSHGHSMYHIITCEPATLINPTYMVCTRTPYTSAIGNTGKLLESK